MCIKQNLVLSQNVVQNSLKHTCAQSKIQIDCLSLFAVQFDLRVHFSYLNVAEDTDTKNSDLLMTQSLHSAGVS